MATVTITTTAAAAEELSSEGLDALFVAAAKL